MSRRMTARLAAAGDDTARKTLQILLVEDSEHDADLMVRALRLGGVEARFERVQSAADLRAALRRGAWDAVIADFSLPGFSGLEALGMVRAAGPDIPIIVVSGIVGEDAAVEVMKAGAGDFVTKENLARLAPALKRELREAAKRAAHRQAERDLAASERLKGAIIEASLDCVVTIDHAGGIVEFNPAAEAVFGIRRDQALGRTMVDLIIPPHLREAHRRGFAQYLDTGVGPFLGRRLEMSALRADGSEFPIELTVIAHQSGSRPLFTGFIRDLSERKRAAEALRANEERFRAMFENAGVGLTRTDLQGRFIAVNPKFCEITGYTRKEALALGFQDLAHPDDVRQGVEFRARLLRGSTPPVEREVRVLRKDGAQIWINLTTSVVRAGDDKPPHFISVLHDVTESREQREKIIRLSRVHAVLSGINALIVRARDRGELFKEACRVAVEAGEFAAAWLGVLDRATMEVKPVAWQGIPDRYIDSIGDAVRAARSGGGGVAGEAIREKRPAIANDILQDPRVLSPRETLALGSRALVALPLLVDREAAGVLVLHAKRAGFFDVEEMKLLRELARDIAFAMEHLEVLGKVEYLAFHDPLTSLPNRAVLIDRLEQMLRAARREKQYAGVVFFDVERFSLVNDTLGRRAGDEFLKQIAVRLRAATRAQDTVARAGADVFAVAVAGFPHVIDATHLFTDRMSQAFAEPIVIDGQELRAVLRAGVAVFPTDGDTAETLCTNAEAALKKAKDAGERHLFYTPEMNARVAESLALETRLRRALEEEQFVLHYQPKVAVATRALVGLEALIRWNDPQLGLVPPGKFIPLMEETGIILHAGRWALHRAVADIQRWRARGLRAPRVAVNVSPIQLRQKDFVKTVLGALEGFGEDEPLLDLEITESVIMENVESTIKMLQLLRGVGVNAYIDDFGTGYCSLSYVAKLPVAALKIDRSFVVEMAASQYARTIVEMVISLAHTLQLKVVAEGVDQEEQVDILRALGCDKMQGYLISKPVPPEQIEAMLAKA